MVTTGSYPVKYCLFPCTMCILRASVCIGGSRISQRGAHPKRRGRTPQKGGYRQHTLSPIFPENCMKMKKFWPGVHACLAPLDPPLVCICGWASVWVEEYSQHHNYRPHPKDGGGNFFSLFTRGGGGGRGGSPDQVRGTPFPSLLTSLARTGVPFLLSPSQDRGTPLLPSTEVHFPSPPPSQDRVPSVPCPSQHMGTLTSPPSSPRTGPGWLCGTGGMPLAFTQEDYLLCIRVPTCTGKMNNVSPVREF